MRHLIDQLDHLSLRAYVHGRTGLATARDRFAVGQGGQTTAEYVAVMVIIAAIVAGIAASDPIRTAIEDAVKAGFDEVKTKVTGG